MLALECIWNLCKVLKSTLRCTLVQMLNYILKCIHRNDVGYFVLLDICKNTNCSVNSLNYKHPWWEIIFRNGRRVQKVFQQIFGIPMGTNCARLVADFCIRTTLISYSFCNRCVIEAFGGVFVFITLLFRYLCGSRGFCHRTESDLFLFLQTFLF